MLGLSSASYESGTGKGNIEIASERQPLIWYAFDEILRNNILPVDNSEFPSSNSTSALLSKGSNALPINANAGAPATDLTSMHRQSIKFDGTDDVVKMVSVVESTNKAGTMLIVFKKSDGANDVVISEDDTIDDGKFYVKLTGTDNANVAINMGDEHTAVKSFALTNNFTAGQDAMLLIRRNTTGHTFVYSQNGAEVQNTANSDVLAMQKFAFRFIGGATNTDYTGNVGEFAFWDQEIPDAACLKIIDSIREKWNLSDL
jgi:hypothetical protein